MFQIHQNSYGTSSFLTTIHADTFVVVEQVNNMPHVCPGWSFKTHLYVYISKYLTNNLTEFPLSVISSFYRHYNPSVMYGSIRIYNIFFYKTMLYYYKPLLGFSIGTICTVDYSALVSSCSGCKCLVSTNIRQDCRKAMNSNRQMRLFLTRPMLSASASRRIIRHNVRTFAEERKGKKRIHVLLEILRGIG